MNWLFKDSDQSTASNNQNSFTVEQQPSSSKAETNSNLSVISYKSKSRKDALPAKVRWWKVKNGQSSQLLGVRGSMYPCEPSDLGYQIKAEINSVDEETKGTAVVWFGPIKIEAGLRQNLYNIISSGHTFFPVFICSGKDSEREGVIKISQTEITVIDNKSSKQLKFSYNLSQPRIQLNAKDIYRICLRFRDENNETYLKTFMNQSFGASIQSSHISDSSQLLKPSNKLQLKLLSRHSRDLVTFSMKAFATKRQMISSAIIQKIQRLDLSQEEQFKSFFQFEGLKQEIIRMDRLCKQTMADRDNKIRDLKNSEEEIAYITLTYTKIINQKYKDHSELNESISILNNRNNQIQNNNKIIQLQKQIKQLKTTIRDQYEQIEFFKFLKQTNNNHQPEPSTSSPFIKKKSQQLIIPPDSAALQLSKEYMKLVEKVNRMEKERKEESELHLHRSKSQIELENILETIGEGKHNETSMINPSFINQSMNESAEIRLLEEKFFEIKQLNEKLLKQNELYIRDIDRRDKEIVSLRRELLSKPSESILGPQQSRLDSEEQLQRVKEEYKLLNSKYQDIIKIGDLKSKAILESDYNQIKLQHSKGEQRIKLLEYQLEDLKRSKQILQPISSPELQKYKAINSSLLSEVNNLKSQLEKVMQQKKGESTHTLNRKIFQLQTELSNLKRPSSQPINQQISTKLYKAQLRIKQLQDELNLKQIKINTLDGVIERLMNEINQKNASMSLDQSNITTKSQGKYLKRISELQQENEMLKRSANALNRSRDLSMEMADYNDEMLDTLRQEMDSILKENERISVMCERYAKDAREYNKIRQQNIELRSQLQKIKV